MFLPSSVSTPSDTFLQAPVDNIHTYKGKHKGTHLYTQVHSQRHKKECTQAQGYSGTLRGIRAWGHTKTPSVTHILAHLSTFTVKATHVYIHSCRTLERSQMFSQVSTVRHTHRVSPARRCSHHHPLQPSRLNSLSTHFPPSSGASGASLRSWGRGWGGVCPADVATPLTCGWPPHPLHGERLKGAGIPWRYKPPPPNPGLCPCFSDAKSEA